MSQFLKVTYRRLIRDRLFVGINFFGLALGFGTAILLLLIIKAELGYDSWVKEGDQIVRLHSAKQSVAGRIEKSLQTPSVIGDQLAAGLPDVTMATRYWGGRLVLFSETGTPSYERVSFADRNFFSMFNWPILIGNAETALDAPGSIAISESAAVRLFGSAEGAMDQTLSICCTYGTFDARDYYVTAVLGAPNGKTHFDFDFLATNPFPGGAGAPNWFESWDQNIVYTYLKLNSPFSIEKLPPLLDDFVNNHRPSSQSDPTGLQPSDIFQLKPMKLRNIHLYAPEDGDDPISRPGDITLIQGLGVVTFLVLAIAVTNYANLTTIRLMRRLHEFSLRKTVGAKNYQLAFDIAGETLIVASLALVIGMTLIEILQAPLRQIVGLPLTINYLDPILLLGIASILVAVVFFASLAPMMHLRRSSPAQIMRQNSAQAVNSGKDTNSIVVIIQFAVATSLIIAASIVIAQTRFALAYQPGFDANNILTINGLGGISTAATDRLQKTISRLNGVAIAARSQGSPGVDDSVNISSIRRTDGPNSTPVTLGLNHIDDHFFETYRIAIVAGRAFDEMNFPADRIQNTSGRVSGSAVLNESAVRALGYPSNDAAIGRQVFNDSGDELTIIGVARDHHFKSVSDQVTPYIYTFQGAYWSLAVRFTPETVEALIPELERIWHEVAPDLPFDFDFAAQTFEQQYTDQQRQTGVLLMASVFAILIACVGLFGLVGYAADRRSKEITIRKIFGASVRQIISLLSWQFCKPILYANLIAWPISLMLMREWLVGFNHHIDLSPGPFLAAGVATAGIAWVTVSTHIVSAARRRPAEILKEL